MLNRTLIAVLLAFASAAQAGDPVPSPAVPSPALPAFAPLAGLHGLPGDDMLMFMSSELGGRGVVKGAPYSATAVSETRQTLPDGNRIVRTSTTRLYRDAQGRTRQEQEGGTAFVDDVVAGKRFVLDTQRKKARELPAVRVRPALPMPPVPPPAGAVPAPPAPPAPPAAMSGEEARSWAEAMRQWSRDFSARMRADPAMIERQIVVKKGDGSVARPEAHERIEVIRLGDGVRGPIPPLPPAVPMLAPAGPGTKTSLGSRDFDGVRADGSRTTWTIPAGQIGNEKPIEIVSERWYAPDLMLVVYSRQADPRSGERIYRLESIRRDEPAADLFRPPADFELRPAGAKAERQ